KASELLPEPETPVRQISRPRGKVSETSRRLCSRAPRITMSDVAIPGWFPSAVGRQSVAKEGIVYTCLRSLSTRKAREAVITTGTQGRAAGNHGGDCRYPSCPEAQLPASRSGRYLLEAAWNRERNEECGSAGASLWAAAKLPLPYPSVPPGFVALAS